MRPPQITSHTDVARTAGPRRGDPAGAADLLVLPSVGRALDQSPSSVAKRYAWAIAAVFAATALYWRLDDFMAKGHDPSLLFLPVVIGCAVLLGVGPAVLASLLCFLVWDYLFVPPRFTMLITRPQDYLALGVFLLTGITAAQLAGRVRREAEESRARGEEIATLFSIGQIVGSEFDPERVMTTLAAQIAEACATPFCVVYRTAADGNLFSAAAFGVGHDDPAVQGRLLQLAESALDKDEVVGLSDATFGADETLNILPAAFVPLHIHDARVGVLCVGQRADGSGRPGRERNLILALSNYTAAVIARQNLADEAHQRIQAAAVTEERNRLTREIHDTVAQGLTGIVIQLQAADGAPPDEQAQAIALARALAQESLSEARRSVRALRPGVLEGRDLAGALREMADRTDRRTGERLEGQPRTTFRIEGMPYPLPLETESELYRIGQEALTNALRHADASTIAIRLRYDPEAIQLRVEDDGRGIDPTALSQNERGFGMTSMGERAARIGATLQISPSPGSTEGTTVSVTAPLRR